MLIQPNTNIIILRNCPLDKTYEHTLYFDTEANQISYFKGLRKHNLTKQSYQRYEKGVLHVQVKAEDLFDCNYLMFQNESFGTKWFYAFITSVEYVNNVSSKIKYEIDVMQTWFFDYELGECFVEREHTVSDNIGEHILPENLETGEYKYSNAVYHEESAKMTPFSDFLVVFLCTFDRNLHSTGGGWVNNHYTGLYGHWFTKASDVQAFIDEVEKDNKSDGIVGAYMVPSGFGINTGFLEEAGGISVGVLEFIKKNTTKIDGYTPRNKKLFTAPYNSLLVTNHDGNFINYAYEYFEPHGDFAGYGDITEDYVALNVVGSGVNSQDFAILPWYYKGLQYNHLERVVINGSPQAGWNSSVFTSWVASNRVNLTAQTVADIGSVLVGGFSLSSGLATGNPVLTTVGSSMLSNSFSSVAGNVGQLIQQSTTPNIAKGATSDGSLNLNTGIFGFSIFYCTIKKDYAKIIDDFFDMFGYKVNTLKVPNRNVRPHWTYTKTSNCVVTGSVPADDMRAIATIYDNGITFWKNGSEVGDYSLDNRPT